METSDLITQIYYAYRGKGASKVPVFGSEKSNTALAIANRKQREWARDSNQTWVSNFQSDITAVNQPGTVATSATTALTGTGTYFTDYAVGDTITVAGETVRTIATITDNTNLTVTVAFSNTASGKTFTRCPIIATGVQEYSLHRNFYVPSDTVTVTTTDGQDVDFSFTKPQSRISGEVYISGRNPKMLTFYNDIEAGNQIIGGTLKVPGYFVPDDLVNATDLVSVDDPEWLVYATASELARNDPAKDDQFPTLLGMANDIYRKMINANMAIGYLQGNRIPNNMPQVSPGLDQDWWTV